MPQCREVELRHFCDDRDQDDTGYRVLVDRLWPRGITIADAALDEWLKDAGPSTDLRRRFGHYVQRFDEFVRRYPAELRRPPASVAVDRLIALAHTETRTLLTATCDVEHSGARVVEEHFSSRTLPSHRRSAVDDSTDPGAAVDGVGLLHSQAVVL
jgi:uncharacterized protein YeaO (DUF488 family)